MLEANAALHSVNLRFDGGKQIKERKRHIVVDTRGLLLAVLVHPAHESDGQKAPHMLRHLISKVPLLEVIFADRGYAGTPPGLMGRRFGWAWQVVRRRQEAWVFIVFSKCRADLCLVWGLSSFE